MESNNPFSRQFIRQYPVDAARTLERVSPEHVAMFLQELPLEIVVPVVSSFLPSFASKLLDFFPLDYAAKVLAELPLSNAARLVRPVSDAKKQEILNKLSGKRRNAIIRQLDHSSVSAGALMDTNVDMLPQNITISEAIRRIKALEHDLTGDIYIVDDQQCLVGAVELGKLIRADANIRLTEIMSRKPQAISVSAESDTLATHPGWKFRRRLPVVGRDKTLAGVIDFSAVQEYVGLREPDAANDPIHNIMSMIGLYWLSVSYILDNIFGLNARNDEGEHER